MEWTSPGAFVAYQSRANAEAEGLVAVDENMGVVRLGVDHKNFYKQDEGRPAIRIESKETFDQGLFIADFLHMPFSQCGLWPAFWLYGSDWPANGEIDIIEGINTMHKNTISAHTVDGCTLSGGPDVSFVAEMGEKKCGIGNNNVGCGFSSPASATSSYGDGFNAANDGVYAMLWDSEYVKVWHFERGKIPRDIKEKRPDPKQWKLPVAVFGGSSCQVNRFFRNMTLVLNTNFCGEWGNALWGQTDQCNAFALTCAEYVAKTPGAFANAFWDIRYIDTYQFSNSLQEPMPRPLSQESSSTSTIESIESKTPIDSPSSSVALPLMNEVMATRAPANPFKLSEYAYLGCFGSSRHFQTFAQASESETMTSDMCVAHYDRKTFAGIFEKKCFCADSLDTETRTMSVREGASCDHSCPGNNEEYCGGLREGPAGTSMKSATAPEQQRFANMTRMLHVLRSPTRRVTRRRLAQNHLLTMYGAVEDPMPLPLPPSQMALRPNATRPLPGTGTAYPTSRSTAYPLQPAKLGAQKRKKKSRRRKAKGSGVRRSRTATSKPHMTIFRTVTVTALSVSTKEASKTCNCKTGREGGTTSKPLAPKSISVEEPQMPAANAERPSSMQSLDSESSTEEAPRADRQGLMRPDALEKPDKTGQQASSDKSEIYETATTSDGQASVSHPTTPGESRTGDNDGSPVTTGVASGMRGDKMLVVALGAATLALTSVVEPNGWQGTGNKENGESRRSPDVF